MTAWTEPRDDTQSPQWMERMREYFQLSAILRLFGMGITVAATTMFLFQHWDSGNDLYRYGLVFGQGILLTLFGLATNRWLQEQKSARLFLSLSLVTSTALFTILGALLYSQVQWDGMAIHYPRYALWQSDSLGTLGLVAGISLAVLLPQSLLSFTVLARPLAKPLTGLFAINASLLLLPVRTPSLSAALVAIVGILMLRQLTAMRAANTAMKTREGNIASLMVMLPLVVMVGRGAYLYASDALAVATLGLLGYVTLRQIGMAISTGYKSRQAIAGLALIPAVITALAAGVLADDLLMLRDQWQLLVSGLVISGTLFDMSRWTGDAGASYSDRAVQLLLLLAVAEVLLWPGADTAMLTIIVSGLSTAFGYQRRSRATLLTSLVALLGSSAYLLADTIAHFNLGGWLGLALLGMGIIVLAAVLERHGDQIKAVLMLGQKEEETLPDEN